MDSLNSFLLGVLAFLWTNLTTIAGFVLAWLIVRRMLLEKRNPGNFFAWFFIVIFFPLIGAPLYLLLGGRKSLSKSKRVDG